MDIATQIKELSDVKQELRKFANALNPEIAKKSDGFKDLLLELQEAGAIQGVELELSEDGTFYKVKSVPQNQLWTDGKLRTMKLIIPSNRNKIPVKTLEERALGVQNKEIELYYESLYLPETIEIIKTNAIYNLRLYGSNGWADLVLPKSVKRIESNSIVHRTFQMAKQLYIMSNADDIYIAPNAFKPSSDYKLFEYINVPWSEGEVAGAPWGARGTEIRYNVKYTGGEY